jgi:AraC-like DNA-binding protein
VARRSLEVRFKRETGLSLHEALTTRRIEAAKRLLAASTDGIAVIAEACGFSSVHYFTTVFKRVAGATPGTWRNAHARK